MAGFQHLKGCLRAAFFCFKTALFACCLGWFVNAWAQSNRGLPNPQITPGATDPAITPQNLHATVCVKGYTAKVRPDKRVTNRLKREQIRQYRYGDPNPQHYEQDHLIPLGIGGHPQDPRNMWPQPREGAWGANEKNDLEFVAYKLVCSGRLSLAEAQNRIAHNWIEAYQAWVPTHPHLLPRGRRAPD
jgi:hypothetical protein